ncbi:hypothetical protein NW762_003160 [Fusarium torreyae]|uniref:Oxidoreductase n=1 Tax=Fusarium torreyae TaxID=1237075 RepID=A0A9W8SAG4_9HYPO|nr:hypothetical protein NW762_003160 [Fusarium torreyae]
MVLGLLKNIHSQYFPPKPTFTEEHVSSQNGRVFIVTGGNAGIGYELVKLLYGTGATIYMTSRSKDRAEKAIEELTTVTPPPANPGIIKFLHLDLGDLENVKFAAETFAQQEDRLDILWNNAGTGALGVEVGAKTKQGLEAMVGMHCVAALLFTQLLIPQLRTAVALSPKGSVRVVWTASHLGETASPTNGIEFEKLDEGTSDRTRNYAVSKIGNWMLGHEMATRYGDEGIVSITQNPGNLRAGSYNGAPAVAMFFLNLLLLHDAKYGAYTELFSGFSSDISLENNGSYIIPWGRIRSGMDYTRGDIVQAMVPESQGGLGYPGKFWNWCEKQWQPFII